MCANVVADVPLRQGDDPIVRQSGLAILIGHADICHMRLRSLLPPPDGPLISRIHLVLFPLPALRRLLVVDLSHNGTARGSIVHADEGGRHCHGVPIESKTASSQRPKASAGIEFRLWRNRQSAASPWRIAIDHLAFFEIENFTDPMYKDMTDKSVKELTAEETKAAIWKLKCDGLKQLARVLDPLPYGIPGASKMRKSELRAVTLVEIVKVRADRSIHRFRKLKCTNLALACNWQAIFEDQIKQEYARRKKQEDDVYQDRVEQLSVGGKKQQKSTLFAHCDSFQNVQLIALDKDEYEFNINGNVQVAVRPHKTVEIPAKGTSGGKDEEIAAVMTKVVQRAVSWWDKSVQEAEAKEDAELFAVRGYPAVEVVLTKDNDWMEFEFKHATKKFAIPVFRVAKISDKVGAEHSARFTIQQIWNRLFLDLREAVDDPSNPTKAPFFPRGDNYSISINLEPGWTFRYRGPLRWALGDEHDSEYARDEWTDYFNAKTIGNFSSDDAWKALMHKTKVVIRKLGAKSHLEVFPGFGGALSFIWLPGGIVPSGLPVDDPKMAKRRLIQSSIKLGMEWKPSALIQHDPFLFPNEISGAINIRPIFGSGEEDCPQGFVRDGAQGCCVYLLQGALQTFDLESLEKCINEQCKGVPPEQARELKDYFQGVKDGDATMRNYVSSLKLTPAQLQWTLDTSKQLKDTWLKQLGSAFDGMMEDSGVQTAVDDCSMEEILEQAKAPGKPATESPSWTASLRSTSWWALKGSATLAWEAAKKIGQLTVWLLTWLFKIAWFFLKKMGQIVYYVGSTGVKIASKGMQLAAWILSDPRRARLVLVLVRRLRITGCKRAGLYLIENKYAVPISEKTKERILTEAANPLAFASEIFEDVTNLTKSELSPANLTGAVFNSSVGDKAMGVAGKIVRAGLLGFFSSFPGGGLITSVVEVVADEVGEKMKSATKEALEIQRLQTDIFQTLGLLRDIFNLDECLQQAGFELTVDWPALIERMTHDPKELAISAWDGFKKSFIANSPETTVSQGTPPKSAATVETVPTA